MGVLHYFFDFLFPCSALHISMGPSRYSILRIGNDSTKASSSRRTGGESDSLAVVVHQVAPGGLLSLWIRARAKLVKSDILAALNI